MSVSIFSGNSRFANDFQTVIDRSVAIASLPLRQLQNQKSRLSEQSSALAVLDTQFTALQTAIGNLESNTSNLFSTSIADGTVLSADVSSGALAGTYSIHVIDPGSFSSALSGDGLSTVADPSIENISSAADFTLTVGGVAHVITPAANNLIALAAAINEDADAGVQATIVNVGSSGAADYRLSLASTKLGNVTIQLNDGTSDLMGALTAGSLASYQLNGQPAVPITSDSRTVTLAPGLTATFLKAGTTELTVARSTASLGNALSSFVNAYNAVAGELDKSRGQNGGPLSGQGVIFSLTQSLRHLANYSGTGTAITSLSELGLSFEQDGRLSLDTTVLSDASGARIDDIVSFFGSATGGGFLKFAADELSVIEDPTSGVLKTTIDSTRNSIIHEDQLIAANQDRIDQMRTNLEAQMAKADAVIALLEQQVSYFTGLFQATFQPKQQP
jgi:flagellar hook-associated protein 2